MQDHFEKISEIRRQIEAQDQEWQRNRDELAALSDVRVFIPQGRLDEIETAFEVRIGIPTPIVIGARA